jgi:hypothetical protein
MPVEIRELVIKTEISSATRTAHTHARDRQWEKLKKQLLEECRQMVAAETRRNIHKR